MMSRNVVLLLMLIGSWVLSGCQMADPSPTPTPTRTPIVPTDTPTLTPTVTPTPTPTATPTPTPTVPPGLELPATPEAATDWPVLPADLYFLREGRLWQWLAEGTSLASLPMVDAAPDEQIIAYRVTRDGQYILYVTSGGQLYRFDHAAWQHTLIPTSGHLLHKGLPAFALTPDEKTLIYLAWDVMPANHNIVGDADTFGTLLALDLDNPRALQIPLGVCEGSPERACGTMTVSPDGRQLAWLDRHGLWITSLVTPTLIPTPTLAYPPEEQWGWLQWSPDSRWLAYDVRTAVSETVAILPLTSPTPIVASALPTDLSAATTFAWDASGLWVAQDRTEGGCLYHLRPSAGEVTISTQLCQINGWPLHPREPHPLPDGQLAFLHSGCGETCPGPGAGVYVWDGSQAPHPLALLTGPGGYTLWTKNGRAFLYQDASGEAVRLAQRDEGHLWDVRSPLAQAHDFQWGAEIPLSPGTP